jgi:hypothetical protein
MSSTATASVKKARDPVQPPHNFPYKEGAPRVRSIADRGRHTDVGVTSPRWIGVTSVCHGVFRTLSSPAACVLPCPQ